MMPVPSHPADETAALSEVESTEELTRVVGENLRRLRTRRGLSLERLAQASGVSRAMLGQVELGRSMPTIGVLWKIARSLDAPLTAFTSLQGNRDLTVIRADRSKILSSLDGRVQSRALFPHDKDRRVEFYELRIKAGGAEEGMGHQSGTVENLVVTEGILEVMVGQHFMRLAAGDAALFNADTQHRYSNPGERDALAYLVVSYAEGQR